MSDQFACPEGFEPVVDTVCGESAMYVEITYDPGAFMNAIKKIWPDGTPALGHEFIRCGSCGREPGSRFVGFCRDEHGVRRLW